MSWEVDIFGGLRRDRQAALADYQAADAGSAAARVEVVAEAANTYILVRTLQARLAVAREQLATQEHLLSLVRQQFSRGVVAEAGLDQAESACSTVSAQVPVLESALETAANALEVLMGAAPGSWHAALAAPSPIPAPPAIADAEGPPSLLRRRPDIIVAERRLAAANARIGAAIAEYYPHFSISALLGFSSASAASLFGSGAAQAQAIAGVRWRLFDFGRVDSEVATARGRYAEALAAYRLSVLQATSDVENAFTSLAKNEERARHLESSEGSLDRELRRSAYGTSTRSRQLDRRAAIHRSAASRRAMRVSSPSRTRRVRPFRLSGLWAAVGGVRGNCSPRAGGERLCGPAIGAVTEQLECFQNPGPPADRTADFYRRNPS